MLAQTDPEFFKPFVEGTVNTLKTMCSIDATLGKPFIKGRVPPPDFQVAAMIGLTSTQFTGSIALCFPEKLFLKIMSNMLGETFTSITPDLQSGAAELLNIIFGGAKTVLNQKGHTIQMARPMVIQGATLKTTHLGKDPVMVLPFSTSSGEIHIEIATEAKP